MENEQTPKQRPGYPWGTLAANVAIVGGAHLLGRLAGGTAIHGIGKIPKIQRYIASLPPETVSRIARNTGNVSALGAVLALRAQDLASQVHLERAMNERLDALEGKMDKKAHVVAVYSIALRDW